MEISHVISHVKFYLELEHFACEIAHFTCVIRVSHVLKHVFIYIYIISIQGVPQKATIQIQISALIQTTYCGALKFIIAFERRMRKNS